jgi:hypothetical protein
MMRAKDLHSLNYIVATLGQISVLLRDFELNDTAQLLDAARLDLETKLPLRGERDRGQERR